MVAQATVTIGQLGNVGTNLKDNILSLLVQHLLYSFWPSVSEEVFGQ